MAAPKHPSRRSRRNSPSLGVLPVDARKGKDVPPWPLAEDIERTAELQASEDRLAGLAAQIADETDSRKLGGLRRQQGRLSLAVDILRLKIEQAADLEQEQWAELWGTPQASMWEESKAFERAVGQFVRWNIRAEQGDIKAAVEARLRGAELGLTPKALLSLRKEIEEVERAEAEGERRRRSPAPPVPDPASGDDDPRGGLYAVS